MGFGLAPPPLAKEAIATFAFFLFSLLLFVLMGSCSKFNLNHVKCPKEVVVSAKNLDIGLPVNLADFSGKGCITRNKKGDEGTQRAKKFQWLGVASEITHTVMIFCLQDLKKERASAKVRAGRTGASMSASPSTRAEGSEGKNV